MVLAPEKVSGEEISECAHATKVLNSPRQSSFLDMLLLIKKIYKLPDDEVFDLSASYSPIKTQVPIQTIQLKQKLTQQDQFTTTRKLIKQPTISHLPVTNN